MFFLVIFLTLWEDSELINTEPYHPLAAEEVTVLTAGDIFVLDFDRHQITRYSTSGQKKNTIGFKGEGPGGLIEPGAFFIEGARVFVHDKRDTAIEVFQDDGEFLESIGISHGKLALGRVSGGWIIGDWAIKKDRQQPAIYLCNERFQNPRKVFTLNSRGQYQGLYTKRDQQGIRSTFVPVTTELRIYVDENRQNAYAV